MVKYKKIIIACDHAGFELKNVVKKFLLKKGIKILDLGTKNTNSADYPDYAHLLSKKIKNKNQMGILICGSGTGMAMTANKHKKIRAAVCYNNRSAKLCRLHNDANVIALGSRLISKKTALKCLATFMKTSFEGGRHKKRINKI